MAGSGHRVFRPPPLIKCCLICHTDMKKFIICAAVALAQLAAFNVSAGSAKVTLNPQAAGISLSLPVEGKAVEPSIFDAPRHSARAASSEEEDEWEAWGKGTMNDFLVAQFYGLEGKTFEVDFEKSKTDPNKFRIVKPYAKWSDPALKDKVKLNQDSVKSMVMHFERDRKYAWFERFDTGVEIVTPPEDKPYTGEVFAYSSINNVSGGENADVLDLLLDLAPGFFCRNFNGRLTIGATCNFGGDVAPPIYLELDTHQETAEGSTSWFFPGNSDGSFLIVLPDNGGDDANWAPAGKGVYTDVIFSSLFNGIDPEQIEVEFERNTEDPTIYRILPPYANWSNPALTEYLTYDANRATPVIIHIVDDTYAWIEEFDTGIYLNYTEGSQSIKGEITALQQAESFIINYGLEAALEYYPKLLCKYDEGNMTLDAYCTVMATTIYNVLFKVGPTSQYRGNIFGDFLIKLPGSPEYNPNKGWTSKGNAAFCDGFTSVFSGVEQPTSAADVYQVLSVELQQNDADPTLYRLVNPYANWKNIYPGAASYDEGRNYYMEIYVLPEYGVGCVGNFYTGLTLEGYGPFGIYTDAGNSVAEKGIEFLYNAYPEMLGTFTDGVLKYPATYRYEGKELDMMYAWFGYMLNNPTFYIVNEAAKFFVAFPDSKVEAVEMEEAGEAEYFNLQGLRVENPAKGQILIRREGSKVSKIAY